MKIVQEKQGAPPSNFSLSRAGIRFAYFERDYAKSNNTFDSTGSHLYVWCAAIKPTGK